MTKKKYKGLKAPWDVGSDFSQEDRILNYKPTFTYLEPPQEHTDIPVSFPEDTVKQELDELDDLITGYDAISDMADIVQTKIDNKVKSLGGLSIKLDPLRDNAAIEAIKRIFPNTDPQTITYDQYKEALNKINELATETPVVTMSDIETAKQNPLQTSFGNLDKQAGQQVPQFDPIKPINIPEFQKDQVNTLIDMIWEGIQDKLTKKIQDKIKEMVSPI